MESTQKMADAMVLKDLTVRKITAKLRDAVIISFQEDGDEPGRYKNIEIPEAVRDLPVEDFHFTKNAEGRIDFVMDFKKGTLPRPMPGPRPKVTRDDKATAKKAQQVLEESPKPKTPEAPTTGAIIPAPAPTSDKSKEAPKAPATPATAGKNPPPATQKQEDAKKPGQPTKK